MPKNVLSEIVKDIEALLNSLGDGVIVVDKKDKIEVMNTAALEMLGFKENEIVNKDALVTLGATDEKGVLINKKNAALLKSIRKGKKTVNATRQFTRSNGDKFWVSITTTPLLDKNKNIRGGIIVLRDINEEKLEHEYHTDFTHIASHNLRTPLGNILWAIEHLLNGKMGKLNKKQQDFLEEIYGLLRQMNSIINDLLSVSNIQNKKIKPTKQKISFKEVTENVVDNIKYYAAAKNIKISITPKDKNNFFIKADERHVKTIVQNILENAVRYSTPKTKIDLKLERKDNFVIFSCSNEGIGIPKSKQHYVFAKFFRAQNAINKEGKGTGLGMYTSQALAKLNGGKIWFTSALNKTTTFFVKFKKY